MCSPRGGTYVASGEADRELSSQADVNFMQDGGRHKVLIRRGPVKSSNQIRDLLRLLFFSRDAAPKIKALLHYDFLRKIISEVGERGNDLFR